AARLAHDPERVDGEHEGERSPAAGERPGEALPRRPARGDDGSQEEREEGERDRPLDEDREGERDAGEARERGAPPSPPVEPREPDGPEERGRLLPVRSSPEPGREERAALGDLAPEDAVEPLVRGGLARVAERREEDGRREREHGGDEETWSVQALSSRRRRR